MYDIWRMLAINDLQTLNAKRQALVNIPEKIAELEAQATSIRSATADGTPVRGGGSGREDMLLNIITEKDELREALAQAQKQVERVERALNVLSVTERRIVQVKYIDRDPGAISKLAIEFNLDERTVRNRHLDALKQFAIAMRGK